MNPLVPKANDLAVRIKLDGKWMGNTTHRKRIISLPAVGPKVSQGCMTIWECCSHSFIQLPTKTGVPKGEVVMGFWTVRPAIVEELVHLGRTLQGKANAGHHPARAS